MNIKKILVLILALTLTAVLCVSCAGKGTKKEETVKMTLTIENRTGEAVTDVSVKEKTGSRNQTWSVARIDAGQKNDLTIDTVTENGAPNVEFFFQTESGQSYATMILEKGDKTVVLKADPAGGCMAEITAKEVPAK